MTRSQHLQNCRSCCFQSTVVNTQQSGLMKGHRHSHEHPRFTDAELMLVLKEKAWEHTVHSSLHCMGLCRQTGHSDHTDPSPQPNVPIVGIWASELDHRKMEEGSLVWWITFYNMWTPMCGIASLGKSCTRIHWEEGKSMYAVWCFGQWFEEKPWLKCSFLWSALVIWCHLVF